MANLITTQEFATWVEVDLATITADARALMILELVSLMVAWEANRPEWLTGATPAHHDAKRIALIVARRNYVNPDQEIATGTGPISSRVAEAAAAGMTLTDAEKDELELLRPTAATPTGGLWTLTMTSGGRVGPDVHVFDSSGSDWGILYEDAP